MGIRNYYRVRALVDKREEEAVCLGGLPEGAMLEFEKRFDGEAIEVVTVHHITFDEARLNYTDCTSQLDNNWVRADFYAALNMAFPKARS